MAKLQRTSLGIRERGALERNNAITCYLLSSNVLGHDDVKWRYWLANDDAFWRLHKATHSLGAFARGQQTRPYHVSHRRTHGATPSATPWSVSRELWQYLCSAWLLTTAEPLPMAPALLSRVQGALKIFYGSMTTLTLPYQTLSCIISANHCSSMLNLTWRLQVLIILKSPRGGVEYVVQAVLCSHTLVLLRLSKRC